MIILLIFFVYILFLMNMFILYMNGNGIWGKVFKGRLLRSRGKKYNVVKLGIDEIFKFLKDLLDF